MRGTTSDLCNTDGNELIPSGSSTQYVGNIGRLHINTNQAYEKVQNTINPPILEN
jgi:hypothetical protein